MLTLSWLLLSILYGWYRNPRSLLICCNIQTATVTRLPCTVKLKFHGTDTDTDTDTDFLADFLASRGSRLAARAAAVRLPWRSRPVQLATSRPICPRTFVRRALFLARMSVGDARVNTCTCTVHDKLSCTRLQNYTIGAPLKSVSVSVLWNLSLNKQTTFEAKS